MDAAVQCKTCRICMRQKKRMLIELFEQSQSLAIVISLVGAVEVQQDDELPKRCCSQCLREVEAAYELRTLCQESDVKLRTLLAAVVKKEPSTDELSSQESGGLASSGEIHIQNEVDQHLLMDAALQSRMCRICMRTASKRVLTGLFEHIVQAQSLAKVVSLVGAVNVHEDDELPKQLCMQCLRDVEAAYKLRTLCQESDAKLRGRLPNKTAVVQEDAFTDNESNPQESERLASSDEVSVQNESEKQHSLSLLPNNAEVVNTEQFSDDTLNSPDPEGFSSSDKVLANNEVENVHFTPNAFTHVCEEIKIEETRITDANYSESDQCTESKNTNSDYVEENSSNNQEMKAHASKTNGHPAFYTKVLKIYDEYRAERLSCCSCTSSFDTIEELRAHGRKQHSRRIDLENFVLKNRQCDICFKVLRNGIIYDFHKRNVMHNYRCLICDLIVLTLKQAVAHYQLFHAPKPKNEKNAQGFICCGCKMWVPSALELKNHSKTIHLPEKPPADEKKPVTCSICYSNYSTRQELRRHKNRFMKPTKYPCKVCGKSLACALSLSHHEKSHSRNVKFSCPHCPKVCNHYGSLRSHLRSHTQPNVEYVCNECGRSFQSKASLRNHILTHTGERPFSCKQCPATFTRKAELTSHMDTHNDRKIYPCSQCDRQFKTIHKRNYHIRTFHDFHSEKYRCNECGRSFKAKHPLTEHIRIHTGERPFSCQQCPAAFIRKTSLMAHMDTHGEQKKYPCSQCDRLFRNQRGVLKHLQKSHN